MIALQDPVDGSPAVLVKRYNITHQKELELQLLNQQEALQQCVNFLELPDVNMLEWLVELMHHNCAVVVCQMLQQARGVSCNVLYVVLWLCSHGC